LLPPEADYATDWIGLYFCQRKHGQQLYKVNLP